MDDKYLGRHALEGLEHLQRRHFFVDDNDVVGRSHATCDFFRLAQHQQVVPFGIQHFKLHAQLIRRRGHELRNHAPVRASAAFNRFSGIQKDNARSRL